ncbi:MAG: hypothetical protein KIH01_05885 [Candidatus Freyarchaeota archaeon]|nr:hypothetical protein [Candidatus Jordarchaeia archaeon]
MGEVYLTFIMLIKSVGLMGETFQLSFAVFCPACNESYNYKVFIDKEKYRLLQEKEVGGVVSFFFDHRSHLLEVSLNGKGDVVEVKAVPWMQAPEGVTVWRRETPYFPVLSSSFDALFINRRRRVYCDVNWRDDALSFIPLAEGGRTAKYIVDGREYWVLAHGDNVVVVKRSELWRDEVFNRLAVLVREFRGSNVSADPAFQRIFLSVLEASADDPYIALDATRLVGDLGKTVSINLDLVMLSPVPFGGELVELLSSVDYEAAVDFLVLSASGIREMVKLLKTYRLLKNLNIIKVVE